MSSAADQLTHRMLDILNYGVAGVAIADLKRLANGLLITDTPGAARVGRMLLDLANLNLEYSASMEIDPKLIVPLNGNVHGP